MATEALRGVFAADHRLLKPEVLDRPEKVWTSWTLLRCGARVKG